MNIGDFVSNSVKNAFSSSQNFMSPGVGSVYAGKGTAPLSPVPGYGTLNPAKEAGLAASLSGKLGVDVGNITADSATTTRSGLAGLTSYDAGDKTSVIDEMKKRQEELPHTSLTKGLME